MVNIERQHEDNDEGVILVIWVLCLSLLAALLLGVITLGNLLQSTDNAQNAADAAALAGENLLGPGAAISLSARSSFPRMTGAKLILSAWSRCVQGMDG